MKEQKKVLINTETTPKVLFLGNGPLRLNGGLEWSGLLNSLKSENGELPDLTDIPLAMHPEVICGTDVENVQRLTAEKIEDGVPHDVLKMLVHLDFDAILTTNYTYEIEDALLDGKWSENIRKRCHTTLSGKPQVRHNTYKCNLVKCKNGKEIPIFHIHGEKARKHSLVLSYYSYADAVYHLIEMNKKRKNEYEEHQLERKSIECLGWLDYFIMGEVYAVGFGFDLSEFDFWWALERKSRENARHGKIHAFVISPQKSTAKSILFKTMGVEEHFITVNENGYLDAYYRMLDVLKNIWKDTWF